MYKCDHSTKKISRSKCNGSMNGVRAFKTELDLTNCQTTVCLRHSDSARYTYNFDLVRELEACLVLEAGRHVVQVTPSFPSKTCSSCGVIFENLSLADRWVNCSCGHSIDRNGEAAINILNRAGHTQWGKSTVAMV
jgi:transposase